MILIEKILCSNFLFKKSSYNDLNIKSWEGSNSLLVLSEFIFVDIFWIKWQYFISKLKLKGQNYSMIDDGDNTKSISRTPDSTLSKVFGYFFND